MKPDWMKGDKGKGKSCGKDDHYNDYGKGKGKGKDSGKGDYGGKGDFGDYGNSDKGDARKGDYGKGDYNKGDQGKGWDSGKGNGKWDYGGKDGGKGDFGGHDKGGKGDFGGKDKGGKGEWIDHGKGDFGGKDKGGKGGWQDYGKGDSKDTGGFGKGDGKKGATNSDEFENWWQFFIITMQLARDTVAAVTSQSGQNTIALGELPKQFEARNRSSFEKSRLGLQDMQDLIDLLRLFPDTFYVDSTVVDPSTGRPSPQVSLNNGNPKILPLAEETMHKLWRRSVELQPKKLFDCAQTYLDSQQSKRAKLRGDFGAIDVATVAKAKSAPPPWRSPDGSEDFMGDGKGKGKGFDDGKGFGKSPPGLGGEPSADAGVPAFTKSRPMAPPEGLEQPPEDQSGPRVPLIQQRLEAMKQQQQQTSANMPEPGRQQQLQQIQQQHSSQLQE